MATQLEIIAEKLRQESISKNTYVDKKEYGSTHINALSDGDLKGKGDNNGDVGSSADIILRTDVIARNKYNGSKGYPDF